MSLVLYVSAVVSTILLLVFYDRYTDSFTEADPGLVVSACLFVWLTIFALVFNHY